jgi:hypothetical protein
MSASFVLNDYHYVRRYLSNNKSQITITKCLFQIWNNETKSIKTKNEIRIFNSITKLRLECFVHKYNRDR